MNTYHFIGKIFGHLHTIKIITELSINMSKQESVDEEFNLDVEILKRLDIDGRISLRKLAKDLEKSPVTIKNHVKKLEDNGVIADYGAKINYEKLGYDIIALIELTISKGKMLDEEQKIAKNPNVFAVYDITGEYDALILARFKSREELSKMIKEIHKSPNVERTNTHLILNVIKDSSSFNELMHNK
jgi:DNA-binding Lrp family transcriptional regulator